MSMHRRVGLALLAGAFLLIPPRRTLNAQDTTSDPLSHVTEAETNEESTTVGGYGEAHYTEPEGLSKGTFDLIRFVIFMEHQFSPKISFVSELEVEHTKIEGGEGGEVAVEQAYLQYNIDERINVRAGLVLLPTGIINEFHEPPTFNGVARPHLDEELIPSTWRELGIGITGRIPEVEGLQYRAYLTSGLDASGFSAEEGIREGRFEGAEAPVTSLAVSARVEYVNDGLRAGGWGYYGGSAAGNRQVGPGLFGAPVIMYGADAQYSIANLFLRGVIVGAHITNAAEIANLFMRTAPEYNQYGVQIGYTWENPIGSDMGGGYIEAAYDALKLIAPTSSQQLLPFVRYERFNTQASLPSYIRANRENDRTYITAGLTYKPTYNTVYKLDWMFAQNGTGRHLPGQFALGIGYNF